MVTLPATHTPVAGVVVDERSEPAYLGYPGHLQLRELPGRWQERLVAAQAVFTDGWAEHDGIVGMALAALGLARKQGIPTFFDPGPGNPSLDNTWQQQAAALAAVVLATEEEAVRLTGRPDALASTRTLLARGSELVIIKRGVAGCVLVTSASFEDIPGLPVEARDATGAGDSLAGAVIYGYLREFPLAKLGVLANATGAAKVQKLGTGRNMPTLAEVAEMLERFGKSSSDFF